MNKEQYSPKISNIFFFVLYFYVMVNILSALIFTYEVLILEGYSQAYMLGAGLAAILPDVIIIVLLSRAMAYNNMEEK